MYLKLKNTLNFDFSRRDHENISDLIFKEFLFILSKNPY